MTIDIEEYQKLKKRVEILKSQADRAQGALEQHMKKLKDDFSCDSVEKAETLLKKLNAEQNEIGALYSKELKEFKEKWKESLKD